MLPLFLMDKWKVTVDANVNELQNTIQIEISHSTQRFEEKYTAK